MTVGELKKILDSVDNNLEVIIEYCINNVEGNDLVVEIATNDTEFYLVGESCGAKMEVEE